MSLKGIWPLFFVHRPFIITHQTWYLRHNGKENWQDKLKQLVTRFATNISVSNDIAQKIWGTSTVIPNPYREEIFYQISEIPKNKDLVFLGRLVSDKGADLLIKALANLKKKGITPSLTIIGKGVEDDNLRQLTKELHLKQQITFIGVKVEQELVTILNEHKIIVVPSVWNEPFGIVALEGIACGCVVIGSEGGGLKDAIGNCGITFPNGDVEKLTQCLWDLLSHPEKLANYRKNAPSHLVRHTSKGFAKAYLKVIEEAIK